MSGLNRDYDDVLRRALHTAAESVEPSADGLERIRERLSAPPLLSFASAVAWYTEAATRISAWAAPLIRSALEAFWAVIDRFRPAEPEPGDSGPRFGWIRPLAAMGTAIFVVAAGAFAVMTLPQAISSSGSTFTIFPWTHGTGSGGGVNTSGTDGRGASQLPSPGAPTASGYRGLPPIGATAAAQCKSPGTSRTGSATPPPISDSTSPSSAPASSPPSSSAPPTSPPPASSPPPTSSAPAGSSSPNPGSVSTPSPGTNDQTGPSSPAVTGGSVQDSSAHIATRGSLADGAQEAAATAGRDAQLHPAKSAAPSPCPSSRAQDKRNATSEPNAGGAAAPVMIEAGASERAGRR